MLSDLIAKRKAEALVEQKVISMRVITADDAANLLWPWLQEYSKQADKIEELEQKLELATRDMEVMNRVINELRGQS